MLTMGEALIGKALSFMGTKRDVVLFCVGVILRGVMITCNRSLEIKHQNDGTWIFLSYLHVS